MDSQRQERREGTRDALPEVVGAHEERADQRCVDEHRLLPRPQPEPPRLLETPRKAMTKAMKNK